MQIDRDGIHTYCGDSCITCSKDNTECVLKKALSNYHNGGDISLSLILTNCPEYRMIEYRNDRISWEVPNEMRTTTDGPYVTLNPNVTVRFNTEGNG